MREDGEVMRDEQEARLDALEAMRAPVYTTEQTAVAGIRVRVDYQGDLQVERTADGFFSRVSAHALTDLLAELLDAGPQDRRIKAFRALRKSEKAAAMERLFLDASYQRVLGVSPKQRQRIADWVPSDAF
ncbi:hypothetical protein CNY89_10910 [Amaricoccus sp. HAR-UPW-R2A-40]|jgi:hypothetical protein|nr:hypothetical protein CNY89_10910 [Amaricoccus sp. HAR-UPW-R2A-40]